MIGFYCATLFQVFLSVLLKRQCFADESAVIYLVDPLLPEDFDMEALRRCGFQAVIPIQDDTAGDDAASFCFDRLFFFTIFCRFHETLKALPHKQLILVYEGITTCQLRHWSDMDNGTPKRFDLNQDIDEFWFPDPELVLDDEFLPKCRQFSLGLDRLSSDKLRELCSDLNAVFRYNYTPIGCETLFLDRYVLKYGSVVENLSVEKLMTQAVVKAFPQGLAIKRHPYDTNYQQKYQGLTGVRILENNVPWELIYLNQCCHPDEPRVSTYVTYNSFAPANLTLLFGDTSFQILCIQPLLDRYADLETSYLNAEVTRRVMDRFSQKHHVPVRYIDSFQRLWNLPEDTGAGWTDEAWQRAEEDITVLGVASRTSLRAFRLQMDLASLTWKTNHGSYRMTVDNFSASVTRMALHIALPRWTEIAPKEVGDADLTIDCNCSLVDYTTETAHIEALGVVEGCSHPAKEDAEIEKLLQSVENIYIWGATNTTRRTFATLRRLHMRGKIRGVFDNYITGRHNGYPISVFDPEKWNGGYIFVCAEVAYAEIAAILRGAGLQEGVDFGRGVGLSNR